MNVTLKKSKSRKKTVRPGAASTARHVRVGLLLLLASLAVVGVLAGVRFDPRMKVFVAGEIATQDVMADQDLLVEDVQSTRSKREQVASVQPPIFDLSLEPAQQLQKKISDIFATLNQSEDVDLEDLRWMVGDDLGSEVRAFTLNIWRSPEFQALVLGPIMPWVKEYMSRGLLADKRLVSSYKNGILLRDLATGQERLVTDVQEIPTFLNFFKDLDTLLRRELGQPLRVRKAVNELVAPLISPSLTLNQESTLARKNEVVDAVEPVYYQIKEGEIIVRQGARVGPEQQLKMQALYSNRLDYFEATKATGVFLVGLLLVIGLYLANYNNFSKVLSDRDAVLLAAVLILFSSVAKVVAVMRVPLSEGLALLSVQPDLFGYLLPIAGATGVLAMFYTLDVCFFASVLLSFTASLLFGGRLDLFVFYFLSGMFYTFFIKRSQSRSELLGTVLPLLGAMLLIYGGVSLLSFSNLAYMGEGMAAALINAPLSLLTVLGLSPIVEMLFGYTSRFKLMEMMNLEAPLLQDLMVNAPGTYHHSLVVSNMVEAAAKSIGANHLLAKVAALYHDVGKLKNPHYFIENQFGEANRHDKLAPSMSALVLISHVKKGAELAREHRLGPEIVDIIQQHHGTTLISYFFKKAQEQAEAKGGEPPREDEYRYPGPKPQTKEAGLILLADVIEASSRTLVDPTPSRIKGHIQKLVKNIFAEGQLDESELTLKDLNQTSDAFLRILTGIFHQRIDYPEPKPQAKDAQPKEQLAKDAQNRQAKPVESDASSLKVVK